MTYENADRLLREMSDEEVVATWDAIRRGGLRDVDYVNGLPADDWMEMVYSEKSNRGL